MVSTPSYTSMMKARSRWLPATMNILALMWVPLVRIFAVYRLGWSNVLVCREDDAKRPSDYVCSRSLLMSVPALQIDMVCRCGLFRATDGALLDAYCIRTFRSVVSTAGTAMSTAVAAAINMFSRLSCQTRTGPLPCSSGALQRLLYPLLAVSIATALAH